MIKLIASDIDGTLVKESELNLNPEYYQVILKLKEKGVTFVANSGRQFSSVNKLFKPIEKDIYYITDGGGYVRTVDDLALPIDDHIAKFTIFHPTEAEGIANQYFTPQWENKLNTASAGVQWVDCIPKTTDKGVALRKLQHRLGISYEETMVFGDNLNDIGLIKQGKYSYAVSNARPELKNSKNY